jgi:hypothetical protein
LYENLSVKRYCSVGLQADTVDASTRPPEGGRYIDSKALFLWRFDVGAEEAAEKVE